MRSIFRPKLLAALVTISACGVEIPSAPLSNDPNFSFDESQVVIRGRSEMRNSMVDGFSSQAVTSTQPISAALAASVSFTVSNVGFVIPPITNQVVSLGFLEVTALFDNNPKGCGTTGTQKCSVVFVAPKRRDRPRRACIIPPMILGLRSLFSAPRWLNRSSGSTLPERLSRKILQFHPAEMSFG